MIRIKPKSKVEKEKQMLTDMITLYCKRHRHTRAGLCASCYELLSYAINRADKCPFMDTKTFCSKCKVHCYNGEMKERIREVMKYSGPRMLLYHPVQTILHMLIG